MSEENVSPESKENFVEFMSEVYKECENRGMQLPWIGTIVSANGSVMVLKLTKRKDGPGLDTKKLAQIIVDGVLESPVNYFIVDSTGEAVRVLLSSEGLKFH